MMSLQYIDNRMVIKCINTFTSVIYVFQLPSNLAFFTTWGRFTVGGKLFRLVVAQVL